MAAAPLLKVDDMAKRVGFGVRAQSHFDICGTVLCCAQLSAARQARNVSRGCHIGGWPGKTVVGGRVVGPYVGATMC